MTPTDLARFGFPTIAAFQRAYAGPLPALAVDGVWGPATMAAAAQLPSLSPHFGVDSDHLRSNGDHRCLVRRELLLALEVLRAHIGRPLLVVDAYRDAVHNAAIGSVRDSQHPIGTAADIAEAVHLTIAEVQGSGAFSGYGYSVSTKHVLHVDVRHVDPVHNVTHSTIARPAVWTYR